MNQQVIEPSRHPQSIVQRKEVDRVLPSRATGSATFKRAFLSQLECIACPQAEAVWASPAKARGIPVFQLRHSSPSGLCFQYHTVYRTRHISPLLVAMAQTPPSASSSSNFQAILYSSLKTYEKKTKQNLLAHPLMAQLQTCTSPTDILHVLRTQVQQFERSRSDDDKLTRWLNPTVNVLYAFSSALGAGIGLVNPIRTVLLRSNV